MSTSSTLLIAQEGKSGTFIRWLEELGISDFLNRYSLPQLVEWGWVKPQYRVTFPQSFFECWENYPESSWSPTEELNEYAILWDSSWFIDSEDVPLWFLDPLFHPEEGACDLLRQYSYSDDTKLTPKSIDHVRGISIKPYADYFYRWQGYALVDVIRLADCINPVYSTPDFVAQAKAMVREAKYITGNGLSSPEQILTIENRWGGLSRLLTWLDHFRAFRNASFRVHDHDSETQKARYRRGALQLAQHFEITHEMLAAAIKKHLLVLANEWIRANEKQDKRSHWTLRAWPHLQDDIQLAMIWLITISGKTFEEYDAEWRLPFKGNWGWAPLDEVLPYDFIVHQKRFIEYAPIYLKQFTQLRNNQWQFDGEALSLLVRNYQQVNDSFAGFLAAFHELHEHLNPKQFDKRGLDFRSRRPLDQYALLAIRAEGCFRNRLITLERLDEIQEEKQGLFSYISKLAELSGIPSEVIELFKQAPKELTRLHGAQQDPIGGIQSMRQTLSDVNHQIVQAFLCCILARNYFAHHTFLDHELVRSEKSAFMLKGILLSVLVLLSSE